MKQKKLIALLLKNLKQAQLILEIFEDKEDFNKHYKTLIYEFDDTIRKAEQYLKAKTAV